MNKFRIIGYRPNQSMPNVGDINTVDIEFIDQYNNKKSRIFRCDIFESLLNKLGITFDNMFNIEMPDPESDFWNERDQRFYSTT